ncbi:uncharacterized protein LOC143184743 [Calliopsis andreniformis]|uniref:uncharacterized protein LOC143184743 n=1 Tax=Calliopsis andreniformis TaxID=337506 RepID=UPI003FCDF665
MSQNNLLQGYNWETQYEDSQVQFPRPIPDEVISVYEVYVKEEASGSEGRNDITVVPGLTSTNDHQLIQSDCMNLDVAIDSEVINIDGSVTKFLGKDAFKYKILDQNVTTTDDNIMVYSHPVVEGPSSSSSRLIDKDDPRSKLHFVKYLKRDGKTLKIWECGICSKEFRHQYTLMRHLPTHTDERNFKCEACGKAFRQLSTLSQHKAIHSDARPYVCEFCKKTFNRVSTLISHRKTHSEHKPHKCQVCGKGFHQKGNLRNHVFTHTNERPYKCELCGKGFNQMSNLVCHKVKAHAHAEKMQYVCGICGKEFPRRFSLRSHEEYKHGIKYRHPTASSQPGMSDPNVIRNKNVRIVQLPNSDRNQTIEVRDKDPLVATDVMDSVVIDKIDTKAMEMALLEGQTPFALFKPAKGIPVLVKVSPTGTQKNILTPATAEDLRIAGKMTLSPTIAADADRIKAVQIKVPVVATVIQNVESDGKINFLVEPPGPENEHESLVTALDSQFTYSEPVRNEPDRQNGPVVPSAMEDCNELLELAAQGGIQFVRATEDGRYEVMTNSEARDLMAQNSHDVTILDGEEADAINVVNMRGNGEVIIGDSDNQIMVLDSASTQKPMPMDSIEILEDKDIRILDGKSLDDRFVDGISFLSQPKIDDLILGQKPLTIDGGVGVGEHEDDGMGVPSSQQELTSILSHRSDISTLSTTSQPSISSLLLKTHPPLSLLSETLPYLKSNNSLAEDLNILNSTTMEDHSVYEPKIKLPSVFDETDHDTSLIPMTQSDMKILGSGHPSAKILGNKPSCPPSSKLFLGLGDVKILGPKNHSQDLMASQYPDMKLFSPYEQFLKSTASNTNGCDNVVTSSGGCRKEVKILGKKLGTGIITSTEDGNVVEVIEEKTKLMMDGDGGLYNSTDSTVISSPRLERQMTENGGPDSFLLQACSPNFLNFDNRLKDTSPGSHFERTQKDSRDSFSSTSGLPDLD